VAALTAAVLMAVVVAFQVALAAGLPLGEATMGGRATSVNGILQPPFRAVALASAVVLVLAAWIELARAGQLPIFIGGEVLVWGAWLVAAFMALNTLSNLSGPDPLERWGMGSITLVVALLVGYVAYAAPK
jgi:hypothetical protein